MKKLFSMFAVLAVMALLVGCGEAAPMSDEDANAMAAKVLLASSTALESTTSTVSGRKITKATETLEDVVYNDPSGLYSATVSGTVSSNGLDQSLNLNIDFAFNSFTQNDVTLAGNCSISYIVELYANQVSSMSIGFTGDFDVTYEGITYDFSWNLTATLNMQGYTESGTFKVNGYQYDYSVSSTQYSGAKL